MSYRNGKKNNQLGEEKKEKRPVKPLNCDDDCVDKLVGAIILSALADYTANIPVIRKRMSEWKKSEIRRMERDKKSAELFFKKSPMFEKTGLSFDYLVRRYTNGK